MAEVETIETVSDEAVVIETTEEASVDVLEIHDSVVATNYYAPTDITGLVEKATLNANSILMATADDTPTALSVDASTIVGRKATGDISAMSITEVLALLGLTLGTANKHLMINAAGTASEYASPYKVGTLTRDISTASGDVSYTGVGFKPSVLIMFSGNTGVDIHMGMDDGTTASRMGARAGNIINTTSSSVSCSADANNYSTAKVKTMDADGFTLTWTKVLSPTGTGLVIYLALR